VRIIFESSSTKSGNTDEAPVSANCVNCHEWEKQEPIFDHECRVKKATLMMSNKDAKAQSSATAEFLNQVLTDSGFKNWGVRKPRDEGGGWFPVLRKEQRGKLVQRVSFYSVATRHLSLATCP
jgi:hypothetical protein